jgi:tetratricopeptide (TPR) repeat protein
LTALRTRCLWADSFDREYKDILALHSEVARAIAREVKAALSPEEAATLARTATVNPEAYDYYLRGIEYANRGEKEQDLRIAIQMYEKAIELDPGFAQAYAGLSGVHSAMWWNRYDRTVHRVSLAQTAAERAFQLQRDLPEAHIAFGFFYYWCRLDLDRALQEFGVAQKTMPNDALTSWGIGLVLRRQGKMEQALANLTRAFELNPLVYEYAYQIGITYVIAGKRKEALPYLDASIRLGPDYPTPYVLKAIYFLTFAGDIGQARSAIEPALRLKLGNDASIAYCRARIDLYDGAVQEAIARLSSESWEAAASTGLYIPKALIQAQLYGLAGQRQLEKSYYEAAAKMAMKMIQQNPKRANLHSTVGIAYAGLGRKQDAIREGKAGGDLESMARIYAMVGDYDEAIRLLEDLMSKPTGLGIGALRLDPAWKPLRNHPRFQALLHKYGG